MTFIKGGVSGTEYPLRPIMEDSTTFSEVSCELSLEVVLLADRFLVFSLQRLLEEGFFLTFLVGTENATLGEKANARVISALTRIRFAMQHLLGDGTIRRGPKISGSRKSASLRKSLPNRQNYLSAIR
jgi:hypothetical protein